MAKITGYVEAGEMIETLVVAGVMDDSVGCKLIEEFGHREMTIDVAVDADELVGEASTTTLTEAARDRDDYVPDSMDADIALVADAVKPVVARNHAMAVILFERVFGESEMRPIERALCS